MTDVLSVVTTIWEYISTGTQMALTVIGTVLDINYVIISTALSMLMTTVMLTKKYAISLALACVETLDAGISVCQALVEFVCWCIQTFVLVCKTFISSSVHLLKLLGSTVHTVGSYSLKAFEISWSYITCATESAKSVFHIFMNVFTSTVSDLLSFMCDALSTWSLNIYIGLAFALTSFYSIFIQVAQKLAWLLFYSLAESWTTFCAIATSLASGAAELALNQWSYFSYLLTSLGQNVIYLFSNIIPSIPTDVYIAIGCVLIGYTIISVIMDKLQQRGYTFPQLYQRQHRPLGGAEVIRLDQTDTEEEIENHSDSDEEPVATPVNNIRDQEPIPPVRDLTPEELRRALAEERENRLCVICQDAVKNVLLLPCRHLCVCQICAQEVCQANLAYRRICPLCRVRIEAIMNIYL